MGVEEGNMQETLHEVLKKVFDQEITVLNCETRQLKGGTVGEVTFVSGMVATGKGERLCMEKTLIRRFPIPFAGPNAMLRRFPKMRHRSGWNTWMVFRDLI